MPEARLAKARATLPEGYQFGDALSYEPMTVGERLRLSAQRLRAEDRTDFGWERFEHVERPYSFGPPLSKKSGYEPWDAK